jgi:hypothetical protein
MAKCQLILLNLFQAETTNSTPILDLAIAPVNRLAKYTDAVLKYSKPNFIS